MYHYLLLHTCNTKQHNLIEKQLLTSELLYLKAIKSKIILIEPSMESVNVTAICMCMFIDEVDCSLIISFTNKAIVVDVLIHLEFRLACHSR